MALTSITQDTQFQIPVQKPARVTRRRHARYPFLRAIDWDFFTEGTGAKPGFVENVSQGGCMLRSSDPIDNRRWLRFIVSDPQSNVSFTAVGRVVRKEDRMEAWDDENVTLYRYGIEFIHALNPIALRWIQESCGRCTACGAPSAQIPDVTAANAVLCVMCHLRRACQNLISLDGLSSA